MVYRSGIYLFFPWWFQGVLQPNGGLPRRTGYAKHRRKHPIYMEQPITSQFFDLEIAAISIWNLELPTCPSFDDAIFHSPSEIRLQKASFDRTWGSKSQTLLVPPRCLRSKKAFGEMKELEPQNGSIRWKKPVENLISMGRITTPLDVFFNTTRTRKLCEKNTTKLHL